MAADRTPNIKWHSGSVSREERQRMLGQRGATLWFTGLSGSGKSTIAHGVEAALAARGNIAYVLDGDNIRHGLNGDLGLSPEDRCENVRRVAEVAKLFTDAGLLVLCALISPYRENRQRVRDTLGQDDFIEIHVHASLAVCEARDPKGLYRRARAGEISGMTGIDAPYEPPEKPEILLDTEVLSAAENVANVLGFLEETGYIKPG